MHLNCPHCQNPIDLLLDEHTALLTCPACGSSISLFDPEKTVPLGERVIRTIGRFQLVELLGSGQFGEVWLAEDSTLEREVALKIPRKESLNSDDVQRFLREARAAAQLQHPNIVRVHEIGLVEDQLFIVSEVIRGSNLRDWLVERQQTPAQVATLCATLADALQHAHTAGVIHRDLKPGNILMDVDNQPHITDFGLAKRDGAEITMTIDGHILGTPAYMPPEQARGDAHHADARSDVYSLGVMLFEMLTGKRPFLGKSKMLLIQQVLNADPPFPRHLKKGIPRDLETICLKAIEKDPKRRYQTALELAQDLRRYIDGKPILARPTSPVERVVRISRRNPILACGAVAIAILLLAVGIQFSREKQLEAKIKPMEERRRELEDALDPLRHTVRIASEPSGANVVFIPLHSSSGEPQPDLATQVVGGSADLVPGLYLVVAHTDERHFHEVYRRIPTDVDDVAHAHSHGFWKKTAPGAIELKPIEIFDQSNHQGMSEFAGNDNFLVGSSDLSRVQEHRRRVPPFLLDNHETTVAEWKIWLTKMGFGLNKNVEELKLSDDHAISFVSWDQAVAYAESTGKRLPDEFEFEFSATNGGLRKAPWGDDLPRITSWPFDVIGTPEFDRLESNGVVVGLHSNVAEWTSSWLTQYPTKEFPRTSAASPFTDFRVVRGGPPSVVNGQPDVNEFPIGPRERSGMLRHVRTAGIGFRCARSTRPRLRTLDFVTVLK